MLERFFMYSDRFQLTANQIAQEQRLNIRQNADFYLRGLGGFVQSGAVAWRARRADRSWFTGNQFSHMSGFLQVDNFCRFTPVAPQIRYPAESSFVFDLQDLGGAGDTNIYPVLWGVERYPDGALPAPAIPANYIEQPDSFSVTVAITASDQQVLGLPIRSKPGDAFAVRALSWRFLNTEPVTFHVRIRDEYGRAFMADWVPMRQLFAGPTESGTPYPSTPFPEWVIPANGAYSLDLWNRNDGAVTSTVELVFSGVRLVAVSPGGDTQ